MKRIVGLVFISLIQWGIKADVPCQKKPQMVKMSRQCALCREKLQSYDFLVYGFDAKYCHVCMQKLQRPLSILGGSQSAPTSPTFGIGYGDVFHGDDRIVVRPRPSAPGPLSGLTHFRPITPSDGDEKRSFLAQFQASRNEIVDAHKQRERAMELRKKQMTKLLTSKARALGSLDKDFWGKDPVFNWSYTITNLPNGKALVSIKTSYADQKAAEVADSIDIKGKQLVKSSPKGVFALEAPVERYFHDGKGHLVVKMANNTYRYIAIKDKINRHFDELEDLQDFLKDKEVKGLIECASNAFGNNFEYEIVENKDTFSQLLLTQKDVGKGYRIDFNGHIEHLFADADGNYVVELCLPKGVLSEKYCYVDGKTGGRSLYKDKAELEKFLKAKNVMTGPITVFLVEKDTKKLSDDKRIYTVNQVTDGLTVTDGAGNKHVTELPGVIKSAWVAQSSDAKIVVQTHGEWFLCDFSSINKPTITPVQEKGTRDEILAKLAGDKDRFVSYKLGKEPLNELEEKFFSPPKPGEYISYPANQSFDFMLLRLTTTVPEGMHPLSFVFNQREKKVVIKNAEGKEQVVPREFLEAWKRDGQVLGRCLDGSFILYDANLDRFEEYLSPSSLTSERCGQLERYGFIPLKPENELEKITRQYDKDAEEKLAQIDKSQQEARAALAALLQADKAADSDSD